MGRIPKRIAYLGAGAGIVLFAIGLVMLLIPSGAQPPGGIVATHNGGIITLKQTGGSNTVGR